MTPSELNQKLITENIVVPMIGRTSMNVRVTAPKTGRALPVLLFSHGAHFDSTAYARFCGLLADQSFVVVQPTHPDAHLDNGDPRMARVWYERALQFIRFLDLGPAIVDKMEAFEGRINWTQIVAAGHSFGGHTIALLMGARPRTADNEHCLVAHQLQAGVMLAPPGTVDKTTEIGKAAPYLNLSYNSISEPTLVVAGKLDDSAHVQRDWRWHADPFSLGSNQAQLLALPNSGHYLYGISGIAEREQGEPLDEDMVGLIAAAVGAFLKNAIEPHVDHLSKIETELASRNLVIECKKGSTCE